MKNKQSLCKKRNFKTFSASLFYLPSSEVDVESTLDFSAQTWSNQLFSICVKRLSRFVSRDVLLNVLSNWFNCLTWLSQGYVRKAWKISESSSAHSEADRKKCSKRRHKKGGLHSLKSRKTTGLQDCTWL